MDIRFDHLVIGAQSLTQGLEYVRDTLQVDMPPGGKHPRMGTHNHLLRIGEDSFLEVISIDPEALSPERIRWFGLDEVERQEALAREPQLMHWVVGSPDLVKSLSTSSLDLGKAEVMTRGDLRWLISIREDGALLENGLIPTLIQWPKGPHPAERMTSAGLSLETLRLYHPEPDRFKGLLQEIGAEALAEILPSPEQHAFLEAVFLNEQGDQLVLR